ncbi:MAG: hypothetical protein CMJ78_13215 [Planctomycetaceae bacterium]|nr:hypothetical protein [Planctomycetaceae bacterium]
MRLDQLLCQVTQAAARRPPASLAWSLAIATLCVVATISLIEFRTKRSDLIDPQADFHQRWLRYTQQFGEESEIIVVVEASERESTRDAIEDLAKRISEHPNSFRDTLYRIRFDGLKAKGLQTLELDDLAALTLKVEQLQPILNGQWESIQIQSLALMLNQQLAQLRSNNADARSIEAVVARTHQLIESLSRYQDDRSVFQPPWSVSIPKSRYDTEETDETWLIDETGTFGFIQVFPVYEADDFQGATRSIRLLRELASDVEASQQGIKIGLTGIPVLEHDEMQRSQQDMIKASVTSTVGVAVLLLIGFRGFRHPLLAMIMLAIAMCWAFGYTTAVIGHLNILSVSFAVILIGLGIDFAIHYLTCYLQQRHEGRQLLTALEDSSRSVGMGIVTAAVTTSLGFFCATMTTFLGVAELGIIAGGGVILCAIATFVVLPPLVVMADRNKEPTQLPTPFQGRWLRIVISQRPAMIALASTLFGAVLIAEAVRNDEPWYDANLLNLQADGVESVELQRRLFERAESDKNTGSILYAVSIADSIEDARDLQIQFEALPTVAKVQNLASRLPAEASPQQIALVQQIAEELTALDANDRPNFQQTDPSIVGPALEDLFDQLKAIDTATAKQCSAMLDRFLDNFENMSLPQQVKFLDDYQNLTAANLIGSIQQLQSSANPAPISEEDLPSELRQRFVSDQGSWLLQVFPKNSIWDDGPLGEFVADVRSVDPNATGTPLQNYEASRQIRDSYGMAAIYALAVISIVLLIDFLEPKKAWLAVTLPFVAVAACLAYSHFQANPISQVVYVGSYAAMVIAVGAICDFRSVRDMLLTLMPPVAGGCLMFGVLVLLDAKLNPANLIVLPLVLGIGVDDGVHVLHDFRLQSETKKPYRMSASTLNGIVLTSLTSMIGFGSMMVSAHRGLFSLGLVLVVGVGSCLFVSLVTLPAVLTLVDRVSRKHTRSQRKSSEPPGWNNPF